MEQDHFFPFNKVAEEGDSEHLYFAIKDWLFSKPQPSFPNMLCSIYIAHWGASKIFGLALASEPFMADHTNKIMQLQYIFTLLKWSNLLCQMILFFSEHIYVFIAKTLCSGSVCCRNSLNHPAPKQRRLVERQTRLLSPWKIIVH